MAAPRHLVLVGPTAGGKSTVAMALARQRPDVELVSVDSMQVYRGMDIGTSKPTPAEQTEVPHHLLDLADPAERFTVTRFAAAAKEALAGIERRGHVGVLVGGTGLYLQAVLGDLEPPGEWPNVRAELEADPDTAALHARLQRRDPQAAARIEPSNRRRVIRALEVTEGSGAPFSSFGPGVGAYPDRGRFLIRALWLPRAVVATRIEARVRSMMAGGLLDEVRRLAAGTPGTAGGGGGLGPTARQALGYKELLEHLEQGRPLDECVERIIARTRAFSVRQRRWFRRDPRLRWFATETNPVAVVGGLLRELEKCHP